MTFWLFSPSRPSSSLRIPFPHGTSPMCTFAGGRVTSLNLSNLGLAGIISPDIGSLIFLRTLNLSHNNLQGHLLSELGRLSHLESLLWQNSFEGRIPADLTNCSNLLRLSLGSNKLTREIPAELGPLRKLLVLSLTTTISGEASLPPWEISLL
ncbi:hypothetical protein Cni_G09998 [Canna indica]|uniref:Uncharacterized protein n=1 Tax=Canna indica TaxID=4628 RepID=A0AAQ3K3K2_9LILI|nr:hypothetical protein Cni_G09998 [Canna indica]